MNETNIELSCKKVDGILKKYEQYVWAYYFDFKSGYGPNQFKLRIKSDYTKVNYQDCSELEIIIKKSNDIYIVIFKSYKQVAFKNIDKLKSLYEMIDELLKVDLFELVEFKDYYAQFKAHEEKMIELKQRKKELEERLQKLEEKLK